MINVYTSPNTPGTNYANTGALASQQQALAGDMAGLSSDNAADSFKALFLEHYVNQVIQKNEQNHVTTGVSITDLQSGKVLVGHNLDTEQFAASDNKLPVTALLLSDLRTGKITLDTKLAWTADDVRTGNGVYDQPGAPTTATVKQVMFDMLNPSGNTAVRVLVNNALGSAAAVNDRITSELGLQHTYLQPLDASHFYLGNTTARDASNMVQKVLKTQDEYGKFVKDALVTNIYTGYGVRSQLAGNSYISLANKVGILDDTTGNNRHDVGVIYNAKTHKSYAYAFLNTAKGETYDTATAQADVSLADMGAALLRYAGDKSKNDSAVMPMPFSTQNHSPRQMNVRY